MTYSPGKLTAPFRTFMEQATLPLGWILAGDACLASTRLQGIRVHEHLLSSGFPSEITARNALKIPSVYSLSWMHLAAVLLARRYGIVIFQKPTWSMFKLSELLRLRGTRTVAIQCDPFVGPYADYFDEVVLTSNRLRELLALPQARVIDDMIEVPTEKYKRSYERSRERIRLVWTGQGQGQFVRDFVSRLGRHHLLANEVEITTIGPKSWADKAWGLDTVHDEILDCDIAFIPLPDTDWLSAKSTNRLTQFMALGMPTIASPIASYIELKERGAPFLVAHSLDDFARAALMLKDDRERESFGRAARAFAWAHFAPETIGETWMKLICELFATEPTRPTTRLPTRLVAWLLSTAPKTIIK